jgi:hypothetical protein
MLIGAIKVRYMASKVVAGSTDTSNKTLDIDEVAKRWVGLLLASTLTTDGLGLGNNNKVCKDKDVSKRKTPSPRK